MGTDRAHDDDGAMTENAHSQPGSQQTASEQPGQPGPGQPGPPPPPPASRPPLRRSRDDRMVAGVCGGLGRYTDVDPLVFRVIVAVLTIFGGSGLLLYALAWLLVPDDGKEDSEAQRLLNGRGSSAVVGAILLAVVGIAAIGQLFDTGFGFGGVVTFIALGGAALLIARTSEVSKGGPRPWSAATAGTDVPPSPPPASGSYGQTPGTAYSSATTPSPTPTAAAGATDAPTTPYAGFTPGPPPPPWPPAAGAPPEPPKPPKPPKPPRSPLARATMGAAAIVAGLLVAWNLTTESDVTAAAILGVCLVVVGLGLLVGAFIGGGRRLILPAILLTVAVSVTAAGQGYAQDGAGERRWAPQTVAELESPYELGAGSGRLDLTGIDVPAGQTVRVEANVGVGDLQVRVPYDVAVEVDAAAGAGQLDLLEGDNEDGIGPELTEAYAGDPGAGTIELDLSVGFGHVEVRRAF